MLSIPTRTSVVLAALVALASVSVSSMLVLAAPAQRKDDKDKKPAEGLTAAQRQEASPLAKLADEVMKGAAPGTYLVTPPKDPSAKDAKEAKDVPSQPAPAEIALTWQANFLKAQQGLIFVPFTVSLEPGKMTSSVAAYLRVAPKGATGLPAPAAGEKAAAYPFEDVYFTELRPAGPGLPVRLPARSPRRPAPTTSTSPCASGRAAGRPRTLRSRWRSSSRRSPFRTTTVKSCRPARCWSPTRSSR